MRYVMKHSNMWLVNSSRRVAEVGAVMTIYGKSKHQWDKEMKRALRLLAEASCREHYLCVCTRFIIISRF